MKLYIVTQVRENYAAHDWSGEGACPQYWKCKGGNDYFVDLTGFRFDEFTKKKLEMILDSVRVGIEQSNDYFDEYIVHWGVEEDTYVCESERLQMEYDGKITYPAKFLVYTA